MWIQILTGFLDGRDRFERGETRYVTPADAERFITNKWARVVAEPGLEPAPAASGENVTLDIQSGGSDHTAVNVTGG